MLLAPSGSGRGTLLNTPEGAEHPHHRELTSPRRRHAEADKPCPSQAQESRGRRHPPPPGSPVWSFPTGRDCAVLFFALPPLLRINPLTTPRVATPPWGSPVSLPFTPCPFPAALSRLLPASCPSRLPVSPSLPGVFLPLRPLFSASSPGFSLLLQPSHTGGAESPRLPRPLAPREDETRGRGRRDAPGTDLMMKAPLTSRSFRSLLNLLRRLIMNL